MTWPAGAKGSLSEDAFGFVPGLRQRDDWIAAERDALASRSAEQYKGLAAARSYTNARAAQSIVKIGALFFLRREVAGRSLVCEHPE